MRLLLTFSLFLIGLSCWCQDHTKIELSFIDYTESDSLFFNENLPEDQKQLRKLDLYFKLDGNDWMKLSKAKKELHFLLADEVSKSAMKKYTRMNRWAKIIFIGGIPIGTVVAFTTAPVFGIGTMAATAGLGAYYYNRSKKHLYDAVLAYNNKLN